MNYKEFKKILLEYYAKDSIKHILAGSLKKPSYEVMLKLSKEHGIPFEAWQDIRAWLGLPPTRTQLKLREQNAKTAISKAKNSKV